MSTIKQRLYEVCKQRITNQTKSIKETLKGYKEALATETKSSAGDKYETGRAMIQLEVEKINFQLAEVNKSVLILDKIDSEKTVSKACLGTVIITNEYRYFLSISSGKIELDDKVYYAVSLLSPVGRLLLGKQVGDSILLNGKAIHIKELF